MKTTIKIMFNCFFIVMVLSIFKEFYPNYFEYSILNDIRVYVTFVLCLLVTPYLFDRKVEERNNKITKIESEDFKNDN